MYFAGWTKHPGGNNIYEYDFTDHVPATVTLSVPTITIARRGVVVTSLFVSSPPQIAGKLLRVRLIDNAAQEPGLYNVFISAKRSDDPGILTEVFALFVEEQDG